VTSRNLHNVRRLRLGQRRFVSFKILCVELHFIFQRLLVHLEVAATCRVDLAGLCKLRLGLRSAVTFVHRRCWGACGDDVCIIGILKILYQRREFRGVSSIDRRITLRASMTPPTLCNCIIEAPPFISFSMMRIALSRVSITSNNSFSDGSKSAFSFARMAVPAFKSASVLATLPEIGNLGLLRLT